MKWLTNHGSGPGGRPMSTGEDGVYLESVVPTHRHQSKNTTPQIEFKSLVAGSFYLQLTKERHHAFVGLALPRFTTGQP